MLRGGLRLALSFVILGGAFASLAEDSGGRCAAEALDAVLTAFPRSVEHVRVRKLLSKLPVRGGAEWQRLVTNLRAHLDLENGQGWTRIDLKKYLPEEAFENLLNKLGTTASLRVSEDPAFRGTMHFPEGGRYRFDEKTTKSFAQLRSWVEDLVHEAFPTEPLKTSLADFRFTKNGGRGEEMTQWHMDGAKINATLSLTGKGTEFLTEGTKGEKVVVSQGELFVFTGTERKDSKAIATVHRTPPQAGERILFLLRMR